MQASESIGNAQEKNRTNSFLDKILAILSDFKAQLFLVFLAALLIRLLSIIVWDPGLEADATTRVFFALEWLEKPFLFIPGIRWPPLQIWLSALAIRVYPDPLMAPILLSALVGSLTVFPLGFLVSLMFREGRVGLLAALIYAFYPLSIRLSLVAMPEVFYIFFICLGLWLLYLARDEPEKRRQIVYVVLAGLAMAGAGWTHLPPMWLIPIFGLLLWGRWGQLGLYLVIAIHPIIAFFLFIVAGWGSLVPSEWINMAQAGGFNPQSDFGDTAQLILAFPNQLFHTLSATLVILALVGVLKAIRAQRQELVRRLFPFFAFLSFIPPYLLFGLIWSRTDPKEAFQLGVLLVPYAAFGLHYLVGLFNSWWERGLVVAATLALMFMGPYLGIFMNNWTIVPGQKAPASSNELISWFNANTNSEEAIIFDRFPDWQEWYVAITLRKGPDTAFMDPKVIESVPVEDLKAFVDEAQPGYLVLSKTDSTRLMPLLNVQCSDSGCPDSSDEPFLEATLEKTFETEQAVVYQLISE